MTKHRAGWVAAAALITFSGLASAVEPMYLEEEQEDPGKAGIDVLIGVPVLEHRFGLYGEPARSLTVLDSVKLVEQLALHYTAADVLQLGFAAQFSQVVTSPEPEITSRLADVRLIPSINFRFEPFSVGLGALLSVRQDGINQFGFGLLPSVAARMTIVGGLAVLLQVQAPVFLHPDIRVGVQPMLGISYEEGGR